MPELETLDKPVDAGADALLPRLARIEENQKDRQIQELQNQLNEEKDARKEERFFFILVFIILFNTATFASIQNWAVPIVIVFLQALFIAFLSMRLGIEEASTLINKLLGRFIDGMKQ